MFKDYFMLLFFAHIVGDFYLQTNTIAKKKEAKFFMGLTSWPVLLDSSISRIYSGDVITGGLVW